MYLCQHCVFNSLLFSKGEVEDSVKSQDNLKKRIQERQDECVALVEECATLKRERDVLSATNKKREVFPTL